MSPTVFRSGPYRFFFFSSDRQEPAHIHVKRDDRLAKFWLAPVREAYNYGFSSTEMNRIAVIIRENEPALVKAAISPQAAPTAGTSALPLPDMPAPAAVDPDGGEDDRSRRAHVPSWDDILLGVRRRH